jgi:hypothetical protein
MGSVAEEVVRKARCPVVTVKAQPINKADVAAQAAQAVPRGKTAPAGAI